MFSAMRPMTPIAVVTAVPNVFLNGDTTSSTFGATSVFTFAGGWLIFGGGHINSPDFNTKDPRVTSSLRSIVMLFGVGFFTIDIINFCTLLPYRREDCVAMRLGKSVHPMCVTPLYTYSSSFRVVSIFPPISAARSTTTEPNFIDSIMYFLISFGAGRPGINAVVTMISISLHCA